MASPALSPSVRIDMSQAVQISIGFTMGIGVARKIDVEVKTDADQRLLRNQKQLLKSPELDAIRSADGALRRWLEAKAVHSVSQDKMFLPLALLPSVLTKFDEHETLRQGLIENFLAVYGQQVEAAKIALGELFRADDYPAADIVRHGFGFTFNILALSVPEALQALDSQLFQREQQKLQKSFDDAAIEIRSALRVSISELVDRFAEVLTPQADGKTKAIRTSTVEKLNDFLNTFSARDLTKDSLLQDEVAKLRSIMAGVTPEKVRESDNLKAKLQSSFAEVSKTLATLVVDAPVRRFR